MSKEKKQRYGIFYKSHGEWTGPYAGLSFTKKSLKRNPVKSDVNWIKNILKSRIELRPVQA